MHRDEAKALTTELMMLSASAKVKFSTLDVPPHCIDASSQSKLLAQALGVEVQPKWPCVWLGLQVASASATTGNLQLAMPAHECVPCAIKGPLAVGVFACPVRTSQSMHNRADLLGVRLPEDGDVYFVELFAYVDSGGSKQLNRKRSERYMAHVRPFMLEEYVVARALCVDLANGDLTEDTKVLLSKRTRTLPQYELFRELLLDVRHEFTWLAESSPQ